MSIDGFSTFDVQVLIARSFDPRDRIRTQFRAFPVGLPVGNEPSLPWMTLRVSGFELVDQSALDGCFDTVVATFTLSARNDLQGDLRSLAERLSPDGRLLFLDHSPRRAPGLTTELSRPLWRFLADGFVAGRDLPGTLRTSGFTIVDIERGYAIFGSSGAILVTLLTGLALRLRVAV